jgi:hypothetical protein
VSAPSFRTRQRIPYVTCGVVGRATISAATEWRGDPWDGDPETKPKSLGVEHWRVLGDVIARTALYSKLDDYVYTDQIAESTGMHVQNVRQRLRDLHRAGIIVYRSGGGRGHKSYIALREKGEPTVAPLWARGWEADFDEKVSPFAPLSPHKGEPLRALLPRRNPEKISETRAPAPTRARRICDECEVGGGLHAVWCSLGREALGA